MKREITQIVSKALEALNGQWGIGDLPEIGSCEIVSTEEELHRLQPAETDDEGHLRPT